MYERLYSKISISEAYYHSVRFIIICLCCGMALRMSSTNKRDKEKLRQLQLRREVQHIFNIISNANNYLAPGGI